MKSSSRILTSPYPQTTLRVALIVFGIIGLIGLGLLGAAGALTRNARSLAEAELISILFFYGAWALAIAGMVPLFALLERLWTRHQKVKWDQVGVALGLENVDRVAESDLAPFLDLPLFRFVDPDNNQADSLLTGVINGHDVMVMQMRYAFLYETVLGIRPFRGAVFTIALFPHVAGLPDFHLAPAKNPWDRIEPDWPAELRLGRVVRVAGEFRHDESLIRGRDREAVARLFSDERLRLLGELSGWTIECHDGRVLCYRHGRKMSADQLGYFVNRVVDFVDVLTTPLEDSPIPASRDGEGARIDLPRRGKDGFFWKPGREDRLSDRLSRREDESHPDDPR